MPKAQTREIPNKKEVYQTFIKAIRNFSNNERIFEDYLINNMTIVENEDQYKSIVTSPSTQMLFRVPIKQEICNFLSIAHGGALSTILDFSTSLVMNLYNPISIHVSISLYLEMIHPAKLGDVILVLVEQDKIGKKVANASCKMFDEKKMKLIATGKHIKMIQPIPKL